MPSTHYRFKWDNYDLERYISNRKHVAAQKRKEADFLIREASIIEGECSELELSLIETPTTISKALKTGE